MSGTQYLIIGMGLTLVARWGTSAFGELRSRRRQRR